MRIVNTLHISKEKVIRHSVVRSTSINIFRGKFGNYLKWGSFECQFKEVEEWSVLRSKLNNCG